MDKQQSRSESTADRSLPRRGVISWLMGFSITATLAGVLTPVVGFLLPPNRGTEIEPARTVVGKLADFPPDTGIVVPVGSKPVIITNPQGNGPQAFSAICTHLGCVVHWNKAGFIQSPCHDGRFNPTTGNVISGPPPRPLPRYELVVEGDNVVVGRPVGTLYGES